MTEAQNLINVLRELNATSDRSVARLTPSLIGLFGTPRMFELFLNELDCALEEKSIAPELRIRAANLTKNFIPQVAGYNNISNTGSLQVSAEQLRDIRVDTPSNRRQGIERILAALIQILTEVNAIA